MPVSSPAKAPALDGFSEATRAWFTAAFAEPTQAQAQAWTAIGKGENTLVIAPTGSGKTLAAFLWAHRQARRRAGPRRPEAALPGAVHLAAEGAGGGHRAQPALAADRGRPGGAPPGLRRARHPGSAVRTGDTAADERRQLAGKPPDILITTPESLFLLLTSRARETLRSVETVIIDEVHALAGGKRGAHLALSLERLDALCAPGGSPPTPRARPPPLPPRPTSGRPCGWPRLRRARGGPRSGSGCPRPCGRPRRWPRSSAAPARSRSCRRPAASGSSCRSWCRSRTWPTWRPLSSPAGTGPDGPALRRPRTADRPGGGRPGARRSIWPHVEERVLDAIQAHRSTIVFANSRRLAERLCARLNELAAERAEEQRRPGPGRRARRRRPRSWPRPGGGRGARRGGPGPPRLGVPAGADPDRGGAQGGPAAGRGRHVQPGARHRHGRGRPGRPGRVAAVGGQRPAADRPRRAQRGRRLARRDLPQVPGRPGPGRRRGPADAGRRRSRSCACRATRSTCWPSRSSR